MAGAIRRTRGVPRAILKGAEAIQAQQPEQSWLLAERRRDEAKSVPQVVYWHKVSLHLKVLEEKAVAMESI